MLNVCPPGRAYNCIVALRLTVVFLRNPIDAILGKHLLSHVLACHDRGVASTQLPTNNGLENTASNTRASAAPNDAAGIVHGDPADRPTLASPTHRGVSLGGRSRRYLHLADTGPDGYTAPEPHAHRAGLCELPPRPTGREQSLHSHSMAGTADASTMYGAPSGTGPDTLCCGDTVVPMVADTLDTPLGVLTLEASEEGLSAVHFPSARVPLTLCDQSNPILERAKSELDAYFHRGLTEFTVPLDWRGTPFQQAVWEALTHIPFGVMVSYRHIATAIDRPLAARPVGGAVGRNPLPIIVPCHRVIGSDQSLTGFTGGLWIKERLLKLEGALPAA